MITGRREIVVTMEDGKLLINDKPIDKLSKLQLGKDWFDLWEVALQTPQGPTTTVVPARNSEQAAAAALVKLPGSRVGAMRKLSRR